MKKTCLGLLKAAAFCALLAGTIALVSGVVERKNSIAHMKPFLDRPEAYDVLIVGDSLMINGVYPMELWRDYGIAAYNAASYGNTLPVTYWTMVNALDYAKPKLVVIGVKDVEKSYKLSGSSSDVHTAFDCYPLSLNKMRAIRDLMDDPYAVDDSGARYADMKWEYLFTLGKYHGRWSELTRRDFFLEPNRMKGAEMLVGVAGPCDYDVIDERQALEEGGGWGFIYLRRMIEECQRRGIDVLLTHLPHPASEEAQMAANAVHGIAEAYGVNYLEFVGMDQVADYATDMADAHAHLNPSGARKTTDYIGRYIRDHYDVPDRRGQAGYEAWPGEYADYVQIKANHIKSASRLSDLLMLLHDEDFSVCLTVGAGCALDADEMLLMQNIARGHVYEEDAFAKWSNSLFPLEKLEDAQAERAPYLLIVDRAAGEIDERAGGEAGTISASFGDVVWDGEAVGVQIAVYDRRTGEQVAVRRFDK